MTFHLPSFLLGVAAGAAGATLWDRLRPAAVELASAGYELGEGLWERVATVQEDTEDVLAEARGRTARRAPVRQARRARRRTRAATR
jgi:hypothetical protein